MLRRRYLLAGASALAADAILQQHSAMAAFNAFSAASTTPIIPPPAISNPIVIYSAQPGSSHVSSGQPTTGPGTTPDCPAGNTVVLHTNAQASGSISILKDNAPGGGNTYTRAVQFVGATTHDCEIWYVANCLHIPPGTQFTATTVVGGTYTISGVCFFSGADTLDQTIAQEFNGTSYTLGPVTPSASPGIAFAANTDGTPSSYTEDPNWTPLLGNPATSVPVVDFAYQIFNTQAPLSWTVSYQPPAAMDTVIATFKLGGSPPVGIGTGLVAPTSFLPTPGPNSAGLPTTQWHLTARPWTALAIPASSYLARSKAEASYWGTTLSPRGNVVDPYDGVEAQASNSANGNNEDRGKVVYAIGVLMSTGDVSLQSQGVTMMNAAIASYNNAAQATPGFFIGPMNLSIPFYNGFVTPAQITTWKGSAPGGFNVYYSSGGTRIGNFTTYDMNGSWQAHNINNLSAFSGAVATIDNEWATTQNGIVNANDSPFNVYQDTNGPPDSLSIDVVGRVNLTALIASGFNGTTAGTIDTFTRAGALTALLTQDPTGQGAACGRQDAATWVDAGHQTIFEIMAQKFRGSNLPLAKQFQRAAMLNFNSLNRWANPQHPGTFFTPKNHFNPALQIGYQGEYSFRYNLDICFFNAVSYQNRIQSAIAEAPAPSEIGGFALRLDNQAGSHLNYCFGNAGGTSMQAALQGATAIDSNQFWTAAGIVRIGRVNWETRLGAFNGYSINGGQAVSFAPTWFNGSTWQRLANNAASISGQFSTTFVSPALVLAQIVWTVPGGTFTQNLTITPDGILIQTTQSGFAAGNWGVTLPILTSDGTTSPASWGATATTPSIPSGSVSGTAAIASATWPGGDSLNFMMLSANPTAFTSEASVLTAAGNITPVRSVNTLDTTHTVFVYPANGSDPIATTVQSNLTVTGPNTFTNGALGSSVASSAAAGTIYIGRTSCGGWGSGVTLSGGNVTFSAPCFFVAQLANGLVTAIEVDRPVTATVQAHPSQPLVAYTPVTFGGAPPPLPTGLLASMPLGSAPISGNQWFGQAGGPVANGDGTTGFSSFGSGAVLEVWYNFPADQYYQFVVPSFSPAWPGGQANPLQVRIDQIPIQADGGNQTNLNYYLYFVQNPAPSQSYSFTAPVTAGWHTIQVWMGFINAQYTLAGIGSNNQHSDRLNIIGTGTPLPAEPPGNRDPGKFPMSSFHFMNTPFGANAKWLALNNPMSQVLNGTSGNGASIFLAGFSAQHWRGQPTDPVWNVSPAVASTQFNQSFPTTEKTISFPVRLPAGMYQAFGSDGGLSFYDTTNPRFQYVGFGEFGVGDRFDSAGVIVVQDSYNLNSSAPQEAFGGYGLITIEDLDSGAVLHRIIGGLAFYQGANVGYGHAAQTSKFSGLPWPGASSDHDWGPQLGNRYGNPNGPPYNCVFGIPPNIAKPGGLNAGTSMMWDCMQHYGCFLNVSAGSANAPGISIYADPPATNHPLLSNDGSGQAVNWGIIVPNMSIISDSAASYVAPPPLVVGQGLGGGAPIVPLLPGQSQIYPSLGKSPYTFPASPVGIPIQCGQSRVGGAVAPGAASSMGCNSSSVVVGSFVIVFISFDLHLNATTQFTGVQDNSTSAGAANVYTIIQPPAGPLVQRCAIAYCPSTTRAIPFNTKWTTTVNTVSQVNIFYLGAYYRPAPPSGLTSLRSSGTAQSASNVSTLSTSLAGIQVGDLIVDIALGANINTNNIPGISGYTEITQPAGLGSLCPVPPMNIGYRIATAADVGTKTINPTFSIARTASLVAAAFANANIAT